MTPQDATERLEHGSALVYVQPVKGDDITYTAAMEAPNDYRLYAGHAGGFQYRPQWFTEARHLLTEMVKVAPLSDWLVKEELSPMR